MDETQKENFLKALENKTGAYLFLHDHPAPDPDALGAGLAMQKLLHDVLDIPSTIVGVPVTHAQNKKMVTEMDIRMVNPHENGFLGHLEPLWAKIFIDFHPSSGSFTLSDIIEPDWVVDHHLDKAGENKQPHIDIQLVGSTCTLMAEYLQAFDIQFQDEDLEDDIAATAMMLGLMIDTNNLRGTPNKVRDTNAFLYLMDHYDEMLYNRIDKYKFAPYQYEYEAQAYERKKIVGSFVIIGLGFLPNSRVGVIPQIADHWVRRDGTTMVVVFAISGNSIVASVRADTEANLKADDLARRLFPESGAGGKRGAAGATVEFNPFWDPELLGEEDKEKLIDITTKTLVERAKKLADIDE